MGTVGADNVDATTPFVIGVGGGREISAIGVCRSDVASYHASRANFQKRLEDTLA